jgi:hypothetical protein
METQSKADGKSTHEELERFRWHERLGTLLIGVTMGASVTVIFLFFDAHRAWDNLPLHRRLLFEASFLVVLCIGMSLNFASMARRRKYRHSS